MVRKFAIALGLIATMRLSAVEKTLSISDLEMPQTNSANAALQKDLERRSSMLQWHQYLGIAALLPMTGAYLIGTGSPLSADKRDLHVALGLSTAALYFSSAAFAIFAPKPEGVRDTGSTKWHRYLSYIHFPLMIAVPILGNIARTQAENGEKLSGAANLHGPAASLLLGTYILSVTVLVFHF